MKTKARGNEDVFARIAAQGEAHQRQALVEPQPPKRPKRILPATRGSLNGAFRPLPKLDTAAKLRRELARCRKRFAPFLRNLAPAAPSRRMTVPVEVFDWRVETDADRRDFAGTLAGAGVWQKVRIPHYGGPIGLACAYYRGCFRVTAAMRTRGALFVCFKGVDYKAHVFVNGAFLGSHEGFFAPFEFEFTPVARAGENVLVVKVENDSVPIAGDGSWGMNVDGDKLYAATGPGWDDPELGWHACPPGMGIYQSVSVEARSPLHLSDVFVRPLLDQGRAEVWIDVFNGATTPEAVEFRISLFGQNFAATVCRDRVFKPPQKAGPRANRFRFAIPVPNPRAWDLETPWLYQIQVALPNGDALTRQFGMRSFRLDTENKPYGRMFLNGREIRLRGANTMGFEQQDVMRGDFDRLRDDILLAKICHMNFWRLTQRPVQPEVYDMCGRLGLLTQTDLPLFGYLPRRQFCEAVRQAEEMERLVRGHPCNILVSFINEPFSEGQGEKLHRHCSRAELERFFEAAGHAVRLANPDRVTKPADGDYDPPGPGLPDNHCYCCWYNGHGVDVGKLHKGYWQPVKADWLYGCGEFGAEGLDPVNVMRKYYPKPWLPQSPEEERGWSPNRIKDAQTGRYHYLFFDTQHTLDGWTAASRRHQAWATRIMAEAFRRDSRMNSMAIHLFIDAFPSGWMKAIMDVDRQPKPAYFAYREVLTPLMANLRTDRFAYFGGETAELEAWLCNDTHAAPKGARLAYRLEMDGEVLAGGTAAARVPLCSSACQGRLRVAVPKVVARTVATVRLALLDGRGRVRHDTAVNLHVFPSPTARDRDQRVAVVGPRNGKAARLARELGLAPVFGLAGRPTVVVIDNPNAWRRAERRVSRLVRDGTVAIFLELPAGRHRFGASVVDVKICGMGPRHFVSRATGHPLVADFEPEDFRLWYDPAVDRISPLLDTAFSAQGWTPILTTGNGGWEADWAPALAAAEKRVGRGAWRICNVKLAGRILGNPVAELFARRLLAPGMGDDSGSATRQTPAGYA